MKIVSNLIIPEFVCENGILTSYDKLHPKIKQDVRKHCQHVSMLTHRPYMRRILDNSFTVMKLGGSFAGDEYLELVEKAKIKGFIAQWNVKRIHGGGRGAKSWGKIEFAKTQIIEDIVEELGFHEEFMKLPMCKRMNRIQKIIGEMHDFQIKPRVKIVSDMDKFEGLLFGHVKWMKKNGIEPGAKTTLATKGLIFPTPKHIKCNADLLVPVGENKFGLSEEKLSNLIKWIPRLTPGSLFSRNLKRKNSDILGRNPQAKWDLQAFLNFIPKTDLTEHKAVFEGKLMNDKIVDTLFGYKQKGEKKLRFHGIRLKAKESLFHPEVWNEAVKTLEKWISKSMQPEVKGLYGVVMPISLLKIMNEKCHEFEAYVTRFPWVVPIRTRIALWKDIIFVPDDLWKAFGGDYDGDQGAAFYKYTMNTGLVWERDKEWLKRIMTLPEKEDDASNKDENEIIAIQLDQYMYCGRIYNSGKIVVDAARMEGWSQRELQELDIKIAATDVQPYIDGFKYKAGIKPLGVYELADKYCVSKKCVGKVKTYFNALRGGKSGIELMVALSKFTHPESKSFYERIVSRFKKFRKGDYNKVSKIPVDIEKAIKYSYVKYKDNLDARYLSFEKYLNTEELVDGAIRNCFDRRDVSMARFIYEKKMI